MDELNAFSRRDPYRLDVDILPGKSYYVIEDGEPSIVSEMDEAPSVPVLSSALKPRSARAVSTLFGSRAVTSAADVAVENTAAPTKAAASRTGFMTFPIEPPVATFAAAP